MKDLPKQYKPQEIEDEIYQKWESSGYFNPDNLTNASDRFWNAETFTIAMPPPNVTGVLHIGHALGMTLEDIMIRRARMQGKRALWIPGTDHAAIATNYVVERELWEKEKKTRLDLGRDKFLQKTDEWIKTTKGTIQEQIRKMGASCDWSREKYTLSEDLSLAVNTAFTQMYEAGLIYRGKRIINWCPRCETTLSNDELDEKNQKDPFYYIRYQIVGSNESITVATTRPETMLGDTAVAVNPKDRRYKSLVGKSVMIPLVNREVPVISDDVILSDFGTGAVKVTPGHSETDYGIADRNKLEIINFITKKGKIDVDEAINHGFENYGGLTVEKAREQVVSDLDDAGFLEKTEEIEHSVGYCYRCDTIAEPLISKQWFVDVDKKFKINNKKFADLLKLKNPEASLKEIGIASVKSGAIKIVPKRFEKNYLNWMENLYDWNISRQIWFGHRLPVWYKDEEIYVNLTPPTEQGWVQDEDTLDTWFSSSLWTFSTLGYPEKTEDLKNYHPTTILETGYDILSFWVNKMIIMTGFAMQDIPFDTVYLHGLIRDEKGRKMSKSLRNAINPLEMSDKYGTDALRLSLIIGSTPGNDLRISENKIASYRNFANKLWNISRYILSGISNTKFPISNPEPKTLADKWILAELELLIKEVNKQFDKQQYGLAAEKLAEFTWNKFADWYIEMSKVKSQKSKVTDEILIYVLQNLLKLWHPFIPFVTEHIWSLLSSEMLMIQPYPETGNRKSESAIIQKYENLQELITDLRNLRAEYEVKAGQNVAVYMKLDQKSKWIEDEKDLVEGLAKVRLTEEEIPENKKMPYFIWSSGSGSSTKVYLIIPNFDPSKELKRAEKKLKEISIEVDKFDSQLTNESFTTKAPPEIVEKMKNQLTEAREIQTKLEEKISSLR